MKIRVIKPWRGKIVGDIIEWPDPMAQRVILQGYAVEDVETEPKEVTKPPVDKMIKPRATRKK
jgi:hypothetical protein